jgi:hypothetical protein
MPGSILAAAFAGIADLPLFPICASANAALQNGCNRVQKTPGSVPRRPRLHQR